jgi:RNA polymerase sigma-70 factor, ECF subfamily
MTAADQEDVHRTIERIARESYGRLVAYLSSHTRDVAGAEDALSKALIAALTAWPRDGVPRNPEAWLLTTCQGINVTGAVRRFALWRTRRIGFP